MSVDYTTMDGPALQEACGDRAHHWAEALCQYYEKWIGVRLPVVWVTGWFATAIEHSEIVRERREKAQVHAKQQAIDRAWDEARAVRVKVDEMIDEGYRRAQAEKDRAGRTDSGDMM